MRPILTAVIAAIEAIAVALAGLALVGIAAALLWIVTYDLGSEPEQVFIGAMSVWQLAHFIPLDFELSVQAAMSYGLAPEALPVTISLAPLGLTLITWLLAARTGWRLARHGGSGITGVVGGAIGFAAVSAIVALLAEGPASATPFALRVIIPALSFLVPALLVFLVRAARQPHPWWDRSLTHVLRWLDGAGLPGVGALPVRSVEMIRLAASLLTGVLGVAAAAVGVALFAGYVDVMTLTQQLQLDGFGAFALFIAQLLLLPVAVLWGVAWLSGAGFSLGIGTSASPFDTLLGPVPVLPIFGAIPQGWGAVGVIAPALYVLTALVIGALFVRRPALARSSWLVTLVVPVIAAVFVGLAIAGLTALATGSIGPDRLSETGPSPWITGGLVAGEVCIGALLGVAVGRTDTARLRAAIADGQVSADLASRFKKEASESKRKPVALAESFGSNAREHFGSDSRESFTLPTFADAEQEFAFAETEDLSRVAGLEDAAETGAGAEAEAEAGAGTGAEADTGAGVDAETEDLSQVVAVELEQATSDPEPEPELVETDADADAVIEVEALTLDDDELDEEELMRSFAWDAPTEPEPQAPAKRNWRRPRSER